MKKLVLLGLVIVLGLLGYFYKDGFLTGSLSSRLDDSDARPVFRIGVIFPLSGDVAHMGDAAKVGIGIFEEELRVENPKYNYRILIEDNQLNASKSVMIAKKMIEVDKVDAIVTIGSNVGNAISPLTQKAGVLHFAIASDENVAKGEYNFLAATPNNKMIEKFIATLKKNNLTNIALVTQNQAAMMAYDKELIDVNEDINILSHNYTNAGDRDFRILISKILADNPDVVVPLLYIPEISIFVKQLKDAKPDVIVANLESLSYPEDKALFDGYWFIDGAVPSAKFVEVFREVTGGEVYDYTPYMYASFEVLKDAVEKFGNDKSAIIEYVLTGDFDTVLGELDFDEKGIMQSSASVKMIKDGKAVFLEE